MSGPARLSGPVWKEMPGRAGVLVLPVFLAAGLLLVHLLLSGWVLLLSTPDGRVLDVLPVPGGRFRIAYTHSVNHFPIVEWFDVRPGGEIYVVEEDFTAYGAGIGQREGEGRLIVEDGWMKLKDLNRPVGVIRQRVGWVADHRLILGDKEIPLNRLAPGGSRIDIRAEAWGGMRRLLVAGGPLKGVWIWWTNGDR